MSSLGIADHDDANDVDVDEAQSLAEYPQYGVEIKQLLAGTAPHTWRLFREALSDATVRLIIDEIAADRTMYLPPYLFEVGILLLQRQMFDSFYRFFSMLAVPLQPQQAQGLFGAALVESGTPLGIVQLLETKYRVFTSFEAKDELDLYKHLKAFLLQQRGIDVLAYLFNLSPRWQGWKGIQSELVQWASLSREFPADVFEALRDTFKLPPKEEIDAKAAFMSAQQLGNERFPTRVGPRTPFLTDPRFAFGAFLRK